MHKILVVVRREFLTKVRSKWFVISTVLGPLLMGAAVILPALLLTRSTGERKVVVVDLTAGPLGERVSQQLDESERLQVQRLRVEAGRMQEVSDSLAREVGAKTIAGYLIVTDSTAETGKVEYRGSNVSSQVDMATMRRTIQAAVLTERLERVGVDPALVREAQISIDLQTVNIRGGEVTEQSGEATFALAYAMWFILYFALLVYGVQVAGAVVEEKSSRVIEVLISSLRPFQLLAGKVLGVAGVGLFQLAIWAFAARLLLDQQQAVMSLVNASAPSGGLGLPHVPFDMIAVLLVFFVLGFVLYATMFAAVGAMSNSEAEARQAQQPVVILIVIPSILAFGALNDTDGTLARVLSLVPFSSPIAMPMRWGVSAVPLWELGLSIGLLVVGSALVTWIAARIYRVGILMYGKRPGLKEIARWVRAG